MYNFLKYHEREEKHETLISESKTSSSYATRIRCGLKLFSIKRNSTLEKSYVYGLLRYRSFLYLLKHFGKYKSLNINTFPNNNTFTFITIPISFGNVCQILFLFPAIIYIIALIYLLTWYTKSLIWLKWSSSLKSIIPCFCIV